MCDYYEGSGMSSAGDDEAESGLCDSLDCKTDRDKARAICTLIHLYLKMDSA